MPTIKNTFKNINTIAIKYAMTTLLHKRRIENHQPPTATANTRPPIDKATKPQTTKATINHPLTIHLRLSDQTHIKNIQNSNNYHHGSCYW